MYISRKTINSHHFYYYYLTMSARIKRNFDALKVLQNADGKLRKSIIENSKEDLIIALCEIIENTLRGTVKLNLAQKKKLKRHGKALRHVADRGVAIKEKKKILVQHGGFLSVILPSAIALVSALLSHAART